ncbi:hypothetical protein [Brevibacillus sp. AG162]|uniref:hypothetical protein n=1 Tax=Brevibacillus sp. AG162 TaxID=2572910 RepID=UPI00114E94FD|nr:hypothetical protein [Brevibacillus sp. AG162]
MAISETDRAAEEEGSVPLTTKFLRWKSDAQTDGWLSSNFIKLYQKASDPLYSSQDDRSIFQDTELRAGSVYGVEIDLADEEEWNCPTITVFQNQYQLSEWSRLPQISDHWIF